MEIGIIKGRSIEANQDGDKKVLLLNVEVSEEDDTQQIELQSTPGDDYQPPTGAKVFILDVSESYQIAIAVDDGTEPDDSLKEGEREIYAVKDGSRVATIRLKDDEEIVLNSGTDYGVYFNELQKAFNQLKKDHDTLVTIVNNLVLPLNVPSGVAGPPTPQPGLPSTANIAPAKVEKVRL